MFVHPPNFYWNSLQCCGALTPKARETLVGLTGLCIALAEWSLSSLSIHHHVLDGTRASQCMLLRTTSYWDGTSPCLLLCAVPNYRLYFWNYVYNLRFKYFYVYFLFIIRSANHVKYLLILSYMDVSVPTGFENWTYGYILSFTDINLSLSLWTIALMHSSYAVIYTGTWTCFVYLFIVI